MVSELTSESGAVILGGCPGVDTVERGAFTGARRRDRPGRMMPRLSARALDVVGTVVRVGLAGVWLVSGGIKAADLPQTYLAVRAYQVLPASVAVSVAAVLPFVEIGLGMLLLAGVGTRLVAALSGLLLLVFIAGVAQAWARGLTIDCGCFGGGGQVAADQTAYGLELVRDTGFLVLAGWLLIRPGSYFGMDRTLAGRTPVAVGANDGRAGMTWVVTSASASSAGRLDPRRSVPPAALPAAAAAGCTPGSRSSWSSW